LCATGPTQQTRRQADRSTGQHADKPAERQDHQKQLVVGGPGGGFGWSWWWFFVVLVMFLGGLVVVFVGAPGGS
jgi:hypothetical protein